MSEITTKAKCPKCLRQSLVVRGLPDGTREMICIDLDCDFTAMAAATIPGDTALGAETDSAAQALASNLQALSDAQLHERGENLRSSLEALSGRAQRLARRQLALVDAELARRGSPARGAADSAGMADADHPSRAAVPAQLSTPEVRARRLRGIQEYHRRRRTHGGAESNSAASANVWLSTLARTLEQEAQRHEQAARDCARSPELFALHIDHSARAFELKRVLDLLGGCLKLVEPPASD